jgi:hypothetical protein
MNLLIALSHSIPDRKEIKIKRKYEECWAGPFIKKKHEPGTLPCLSIDI